MYVMAFKCMFFTRVLMADSKFFKYVSFLMECLCMEPLTHIVMVMTGLVCHPLFLRVLIRGLYLLCLCMRAWSGNLSW